MMNRLRLLHTTRVAAKSTIGLRAIIQPRFFSCTSTRFYSTQQESTSSPNQQQSTQQQQPQEVIEPSDHVKQETKILSAEELKQAAERAQQEAQTRQEMEMLLRTVLWRGLRAALLFVAAFSAFFIVVKQKGSESRVVKYLEELKLKRAAATKSDEVEEESEQDKKLKEALDKSRQLKKEMNDSTWYVKDAKDQDIDPEFAKEQQRKIIQDKTKSS